MPPHLAKAEIVTLIFNFFVFIFLSVWLFTLHISLCGTFIQCPQRPEEGALSLGTRVTDCWESSCGCWKQPGSSGRAACSELLNHFFRPCLPFPGQNIPDCLKVEALDSELSKSKQLSIRSFISAPGDGGDVINCFKSQQRWFLTWNWKQNKLLLP